MSISVDDVIRELVRTELGSQSRGAGARRVGWRDVLWAALALLNIGLLVWSISPTILSDERFKILTDVLPWVAGTFFAVAASWFKEAILAALSKPAFKVANLAAFFVLAALQFPLVPIRVAYEPAVARIRIDGRPSPAGGYVRLASHSVQLVTPNQDRFRNGPEFTLGFIGLIRQAVFPPPPDSRWRLKASFSVRIEDDDSGSAVRIASAVPYFDAFEASDNVTKMIADSSPTHILFQTREESLETEVIGWFPVGTYVVTVTRDTCTPLERTIVVKDATEHLMPRLVCR